MDEQNHGDELHVMLDLVLGDVGQDQHFRVGHARKEENNVGHFRVFVPGKPKSVHLTLVSPPRSTCATCLEVRKQKEKTEQAPLDKLLDTAVRRIRAKTPEESSRTECVDLTATTTPTTTATTTATTTTTATKTDSSLPPPPPSQQPTEGTSNASITRKRCGGTDHSTVVRAKQKLTTRPVAGKALHRLPEFAAGFPPGHPEETEEEVAEEKRTRRRKATTGTSAVAGCRKNMKKMALIYKTDVSYPDRDLPNEMTGETKFKTPSSGERRVKSAPRQIREADVSSSSCRVSAPGELPEAGHDRAALTTSLNLPGSSRSCFDRSDREIRTAGHEEHAFPPDAAFSGKFLSSAFEAPSKKHPRRGVDSSADPVPGPSCSFAERFDGPIRNAGHENAVFPSDGPSSGKSVHRASDTPSKRNREWDGADSSSVPGKVVRNYDGESSTGSRETGSGSKGQMSSGACGGKKPDILGKACKAIMASGTEDAFSDITVDENAGIDMDVGLEELFEHFSHDATATLAAEPGPSVPVQTGKIIGTVCTVTEEENRCLEEAARRRLQIIAVFDDKKKSRRSKVSTCGDSNTCAFCEIPLDILTKFRAVRGYHLVKTSCCHESICVLCVLMAVDRWFEKTLEVAKPHWRFMSCVFQCKDQPSSKKYSDYVLPSLDEEAAYVAIFWTNLLRLWTEANENEITVPWLITETRRGLCEWLLNKHDGDMQGLLDDSCPKVIENALRTFSRKAL